MRWIRDTEPNSELSRRFRTAMLITFFSNLVLAGLKLAAAYSSADGSLTSLTTSFSVDFLGLKKNTILSEKRKIQIRKRVHFSMAVMLILLILLFRAISDESVIQKLFTIAGYTYGPLLGLFSFGLFTKRMVKDRWVPAIAVLSPIICWVLSTNSEQWLWGYRFGFELLIVNGALTFGGLLLLSVRKQERAKPTS